MDLLSRPFEMPESLSFQNYREVLSRQPMLRYLFNTFSVALIAVAVDVTVSVMTGYAMLHRFRMRRSLSVMFHVGLFIPANAFMVPYYIMITRIGGYDTLWGLGLVYAAVNLPSAL